MNWIDEGIALIRLHERLGEMEAPAIEEPMRIGNWLFFEEMNRLLAAGEMGPERLCPLPHFEDVTVVIDNLDNRPLAVAPPQPPRRHPRPRWTWSDLAQLLIAGLAVVCLLLSAIR